MISTRTFNSIILLLLIAANAESKDLGAFGKTFPIAEPDALSEIEDRAKQIDWSKMISREEAETKIKGFKPQGIKDLPRAKKVRHFSVDLTYALDFDIPDGIGGISYPRGFTFNPLDHIKYPFTLVVIDGADREQVEWFKKSEFNKDIRVKLLITAGNWYDLAKETGRPVYYAMSGLPERFRLEAVPSIVRQRGVLMEVTEIDVESERQKIEKAD